MNQALTPFFSNLFELEGYLHMICRELKDLGLWLVREAKAGRPVSANEEKWMRELMRESELKLRYQALNRVYVGLPDRITSARLWNKIIGY